MCPQTTSTLPVSFHYWRQRKFKRQKLLQCQKCCIINENGAFFFTFALHGFRLHGTVGVLRCHGNCSWRHVWHCCHGNRRRNLRWSCSRGVVSRYVVLLLENLCEKLIRLKFKFIILFCNVFKQNTALFYYKRKKNTKPRLTKTAQ